MDVISLIKSMVERIPFPVGKAISRVPYAMRPGIGAIYRQRSVELENFGNFSSEKKSNYIFHRMKSIVEHAYRNIDFYREYYSQQGFTPDQLVGFDDLAKIPVVNKNILKECSLEKRSLNLKGRYLVNTGGSSGNPLSFYILPSSIGHEWAHMHHIWSKLGYRPYDLKLCFGGRDLKNTAVRYDALRHHFAINIYYPNVEIACSLKPILQSCDIRYLHGYPSALYDFACYCENNDPELADLLSQKLKGAFLGSEFPSPVYRNKIESVFNIPTVSWYGHTERAVLAWELDNPYIYVPFQTYGFAEAKHDDVLGITKLVATSYYNTASPLIRYDTGDEIEVVSSTAAILESFSIAGGREGDYVVDLAGKKISLTGLVFGRHHRIFERAKFVQVYQSKPGFVTIFVTSSGAKIPDTDICNFFDLGGININFSIEQINEPMLTSGGKVILNITGIIGNNVSAKENIT